MWLHMPNITLSINEETKQRMRQHPDVRWSNAIRSMIERKLRDFEEAERLVQKSRLTEKDVEWLTKQVAKDSAQRAKRLLNESHG